jgi:serine/threonine-protein kinase
VTEVPDVRGQNESAATETLRAAGFEVRVDQAYSDSVSSGVVAAQSPPPGVYAGVGSPVELSISQGPAPAESVAIPDVTGLPQQEATQILSNAGLAVETIQAYSDEFAAGSVIGQAPSAGLQTPPGATVTIAVSQGAPPIEEAPPPGEEAPPPVEEAPPST